MVAIASQSFCFLFQFDSGNQVSNFTASYLCWPSIKNQLLVRDATMLYKIVNSLAPPYLECYVNKRSAIHSYNTRSRDNLVVPFCKTATAQRFFSYRAITAWNSLISKETKNSATLSVFKRAVKREIYKVRSNF